MYVAGYDPGGRTAFGWAAVAVDASGACSRVQTGVVSDAPSAVAAVASALGDEALSAAGIDAPLFWIERGDRVADQRIRRRVIAAGGAGGTVSAVNSLQGSCLVQGILTARLIQQRWPEAIVTEAHPKALLRVWPDAAAFVGRHLASSATEHERDALIAAYCALRAALVDPAWTDLVKAETRPFFPSGSPVHYWFPN